MLLKGATDDKCPYDVHYRYMARFPVIENIINFSEILMTFSWVLSSIHTPSFTLMYTNYPNICHWFMDDIQFCIVVCTFVHMTIDIYNNSD